jgi:hypothetical protein
MLSFLALPIYLYYGRMVDAAALHRLAALSSGFTVSRFPAYI